MSYLLTTGILQQVRNADSVGEANLLYSGILTVGLSGGTEYGYVQSPLIGSISPADNLLTRFTGEPAKVVEVIINYNSVAYSSNFTKLDGVVPSDALVFSNYLKNAYNASQTVAIKLYSVSQI